MQKQKGFRKLYKCLTLLLPVGQNDFNSGAAAGLAVKITDIKLTSNKMGLK